MSRLALFMPHDIGDPRTIFDGQYLSLSKLRMRLFLCILHGNLCLSQDIVVYFVYWWTLLLSTFHVGET